MKYWTWAEIKGKVLRDLDLEGESFIQEDELLGYANEAVDEVERQIHTLCEDYFLSRLDLPLVSGQEEYSLPSDIFAMKLRQIVYRNGTQVWKLERIREWHKFETYESDRSRVAQNQMYGYFILNKNAGSPKILITPTPTESGDFLKVWYIRNANELVDDSSILDIPEAAGYIIQSIKVRCYEKELHPNLQKAIADLAGQREDTIKSLSEMFADNQNILEADTRLYDEMY